MWHKDIQMKRGRGRPQKAGRVKTTITIDQEILLRIKHVAIDLRTNVSALIEEQMRDWLNSLEKK